MLLGEWLIFTSYQGTAYNATFGQYLSIVDWIFLHRQNISQIYFHFDDPPPPYYSKTILVLINAAYTILWTWLTFWWMKIELKWLNEKIGLYQRGCFRAYDCTSDEVLREDFFSILHRIDGFEWLRNVHLVAYRDETIRRIWRRSTSAIDNRLGTRRTPESISLYYIYRQHRSFDICFMYF